MEETKPFLLVKTVYAKEQDRGGERGYLVYFPWEAQWIPKDIFECWALPLEDARSITEAEVGGFLGSDVTMAPADEKTTIVRADMVSGFVAFETSSCVSPEKFDLEKGASIALRKIREKLWEHLGFVLQWGINGVRKDSSSKITL